MAGIEPKEKQNESLKVGQGALKVSDETNSTRTYKIIKNKICKIFNTAIRFSTFPPRLIRCLSHLNHKYFYCTKGRKWIAYYKYNKLKKV